MNNYCPVGIWWILCWIIAWTLTLSHVSGSGEVCDLSDDLNTCYKKFLSFEAIGHIHKLLDNDKNGEVDPSETDKFLRQEFSLTERATKSRSLVEDDPLISLHDLWSLWKNNPAFNWTVKQTADWLSNCVELAQYQEVFARHNIDGKALPLLAMQNMSYISDVLLIRNPIHKRKLMLKALDTILFGPPHKPGMLSVRDPVFTAATFGLIAALLVFAASLRVYCAPAADVKSCAPDSSGLGVSGNEEALRQLQRRLDDLEYLRCTLSNTDCVFDPAGRPLDPKNTGHRNSGRSVIQAGQLSNSGKYTRAQSLSDHKEHLEQPPADENDLVIVQGNTGTHPAPTFSLGRCIGTRGDYTGNEYGSRGESAVLFDAAIPCADSAREMQSTANSASSNAVDSQLSRSNSTTSLYGVVGTGAEKSDRVLSGQQQLVLLLQITHELEMKHFNTRRSVAEKELALVRAECKRLHRKRYNILGSVRLVHSDDFDDLEQRMLNAKLLMEHLQEEIRESTARWMRVEALTGHCLRQNPGLEKLSQALPQLTGSSPGVVGLSTSRNAGGPGLLPANCHQLAKTSSQWVRTDSDASTSVGGGGGGSLTSSSALSESTLFLSTAAAGVSSAYPIDLNDPVTGITAKYSLSHQRHHSHTLPTKSGLPRNYSFVRPFATLWRKKAGCRTANSISKKIQ